MTITVGPALPGGAGAGGWGLPEAEVAEDAAVTAAGAPAADAAGPITEAPASPFAGLPPLDARLVLQLQLAACSLATPDASAAGIARFHAALSALLGTLPAPGSPQVRGPEPSPSAVAPPVSQTITVRADPAELAVADLLRLDPELQALLAPFARDAAMPDTALGRQLIALYGPERAAALHRLAGASAEVRRLFLSALDDALRRTPLGPAGFTTSAAGQYAADGHLAPAGLPPWWRLTHHGSAFDSPHTLATFDPAAFVAAYAAQDTPAARAFADLHGPEVVRLSHTQTGPEGDRWEIAHRLIGSGRFELRLGFNDSIEHQASRWVPSTLGTPWTGGLAVLDPARPVELFQPDLIRFDPAMGFVTPSANLVPEDDWVDQALVLGAGAFAGWFGAQVIAPALGGGSLGAAAAGAAASAAGSLVATGSIHLKDVLRGALSSLVTAGLSQAAGLDTLGYQLDDAGKVVLEGGRPVIASYTLRSMAVLGTASVKGLVTELAGGRFQDGFRQGLALDLAQGLAGELVREFDAHIAARLKAGTLGPGEASVLQTLGRAVGTAVRVAATPGDPAAALAAELLQTLGEAIGEDIVLAGVAGLPPHGPMLAFDDEGFLMPGVVDASAILEVQQSQLAQVLAAQGLDAPMAAWLAGDYFAPSLLVRDGARLEAEHSRLAEQVEAELAAFEPGSSVELLAGTGGGYPERLGLLQDRLARMTEVGEPFLVERHQVFVQAQVGKYQALEAQAQAQGDLALLRVYRDERALFEATQVRLAQRAIQLDYRHATLRYAERLSASGDATGFSHQELMQAAQRLATGQSSSDQAVDAYLRARMARDDTRLYLTVLGQGSIGSLVGLDGAGISGARLRPGQQQGSAPGPGAPFSHLVPGGGLAVHEAMGGHLIARHVAQTDAALGARLTAQPRIVAASSFTSRAEAEAAITSALNARASHVRAWISTGASGRLVIDAPFSGGAVLQRGASVSVSGTGVRVVLEGTGNGSWRIITGFPTP